MDVVTYDEINNVSNVFNNKIRPLQHEIGDGGGVFLIIKLLNLLIK